MSSSSGISGLKAAMSQIDIISHNISNGETNGFKSIYGSLADMYAGSKIGIGVKVEAIRQNFTDGSIQSTERPLDVALSGQSFFRLKDNNGAVFYSRNGQFALDENRYLVNTGGLKVTGYAVGGDSSTLQKGADPVALQIPDTLMSAKVTTTASLAAKLNSADKVPKTQPIDTKNPDSYNAKTTMTAYDSLGNPHTIELYFVKNSADDKRTNSSNNSWNVFALDATTNTGSKYLTMTFDTNGVLTSEAKLPVTMGALNGTNQQQDFMLDLSNSMQQNLGRNSFSNPIQNGYRTGELTKYEIAADGTLVGHYTNEKNQVLGQIVLANFANQQGLSAQGDNLLRETSSSGLPMLGGAGMGSFARLTVGALESSNIDKTAETVALSVMQQMVQMSAKAMKTELDAQQSILNIG